ncbi:hypothetical protein [Kosakonia cowanii]|uniref:hypothetical protein n=1 Tax=Kosakonia cowanii TaxID=208223 RepID=UPI001F5A11C9|nr:hypothetical protein [Kosakonia cowanii]
MDNTYMRFYEHDFYKKNKIVRDKVEKYFLQGKEYNFKKLSEQARVFYNNVIIEFIDKCKEEKEKGTGKHFKQYAKDVLSNHRMSTSEDMIWCEYYFLTNSEIDRCIDRAFNYKILESAAVKVPIYELTGSYGKYHLVQILSYKEERDGNI